MINLLNKIIDFLFPAQCSGCKEYGAFFCKKCLKKIIKRDSFEIKSNNLLKIFAFYRYHSNKKLKNIIKNIKYNHLFSSIDEISVNLTQILENNFKNQKMILVPVPLHWIRKFKRGFNQSELISLAIIEKSTENQKISLKNLLKRTKNTAHQTLLDKKGRLLNLKNAFKINKIQEIDSKIPIILVDDICTTGETLENCAIELKKYYKNPIYGLVIASDKK